jgi:putative SOS response-associated peptidase YedK
MRRSLVLTDESARHWLRASLPPHIKRDLIPVPADALWRLTAEDVRGFASVYVAATAALLVFIM